MHGGVAGVRMPEPIRVRERANARDSVRASESEGEQAASPNAYLPTTGDVKSMQFRWTRACGVYKLLDNTVVHRGDGVLPYRPVIGDLAMAPGTGKYYYEIRVNTDNCRVGVCTANAYPTDKSLELYALGEGVAALPAAAAAPVATTDATSKSNSSNNAMTMMGGGGGKQVSSSQRNGVMATSSSTVTSSSSAAVNGGMSGGGNNNAGHGGAVGGQLSYLETIGAVPPPPSERPLVAYLDVQTSRVYGNGVELKHLWRLFVPAAGCLFGFVVDMDEGVVQLFVDKKYAGLVFDGRAGLKGATLYPCVGFAGMDMNNLNIGRGIFSATIGPPQRFSGVY